MAQLTNDCFAAGDRLLPMEEALALIAARVACIVGTERVPLAEADGRVLGEPLTAGVNLPPFDNSAVDGYAVRFGDLSPADDTVLPISGRIAAGARPAAAETAGAVRIFTGAPMPAGFDTVFMQEDVVLEGPDRARLPKGLKRGANRRLAGEDLAAGALALPAGRRLRPADLALLGALGLADAPVRQRLRVAVLSTGDEVAAPGKPLRPGQLYDANRPMLAALLRRSGCTVSDLGIVPDRREAMHAALTEAAACHDLILTSGGVSTGEEDHVRATVESAGALTFWRIGIKPGRPVAMGVVAGSAFMGLPGNPAAAFVTFAFLGRALVARLAGEEFRAPEPVEVAAGFAYRKKEGRREYVRVRLTRGGDGRLRAEKHPREGAGVITSLTETDGLVELREDATGIVPGDPVGFYPYAVLY
ncbi:molybdopterin molybdotransferase MoeA [Enterovirga aerilata]|uniref:Molybdopterin molybdenumtransferase n=1 Tax=Enterovirga aerilata TaxID=2730920 RepID=A0A849HXF3_9HYPH|nr:gephyrin-like molybdotransferase Glp [Enterovirga sp. DB1703]NNM72226.1 molybdopterin molybdotransferase MoeA [Enterovirga sp. DB1703]